MSKGGREGDKEGMEGGGSLVAQEILGHRIKVHPRNHSRLHLATSFCDDQVK